MLFPMAISICIINVFNSIQKYTEFAFVSRYKKLMKKNEISANHSLVIEKRWLLWKYATAGSPRSAAKRGRRHSEKMAAMKHMINLEKLVISNNTARCVHNFLNKGASGKFLGIHLPNL